MAMVEPIVERLIAACRDAAHQYYRLVLFIAPAGSGKTAALREVAHRLGASCVNVNLDVSRQLLDLTERQRSLYVPRMLADIVDRADAPGGFVILDNTELLFDAALKQDPLRLLQQLSRNQTVLASWGGCIDNGCLVYGEPSHPEYRRYSIQDQIVIVP